MSEHKRCGTCWWWEDMYPGTEKFQRSRRGLCRLRPPVVFPHQAPLTVTAFPETRTDDWCGEHKEREEAGGGKD